MTEEILNKIAWQSEVAKTLKSRVEELADRPETEPITIESETENSNGTRIITFQIPLGAFIVGFFLRDLGFHFAPRDIKIVNTTITTGSQITVNLFLSSPAPSLAYRAKLSYYLPTT